VSERRNAGHFSVLGSRPHKGATEDYGNLHRGALLRLEAFSALGLF
jgi:hypothetical protein